MSEALKIENVAKLHVWKLLLNISSSLRSQTTVILSSCSLPKWFQYIHVAYIPAKRSLQTVMRFPSWQKPETLKHCPYRPAFPQNKGDSVGYQWVNKLSNSKALLSSHVLAQTARIIQEFLSPIMFSYITDTGLIVIGHKAYQTQGTQCSRQTGSLLANLRRGCKFVFLKYAN